MLTTMGFTFEPVLNMGTILLMETKAVRALLLLNSPIVSDALGSCHWFETLNAEERKCHGGRFSN